MSAHNCFDFSICRYCYQKKESDHLCKLRWPKPVMSHNRLCFFNVIFNEAERLDPYLALFYREEKERGSFTKHCLFDELAFGFTNEIDENYVSFNYFAPECNIEHKDFTCLNRKRKKKKTEDFRRNVTKLSEREHGLKTKILKFILDEDYHHTTYICNSSMSQTVLVS